MASDGHGHSGSGSDGAKIGTDGLADDAMLPALSDYSGTVKSADFITKGPHVDVRAFYLPPQIAPAGVSTPLSTRFSTLVEAQAVYPHANNLTDEMDWAVIQKAINFVHDGGGGVAKTPRGMYWINNSITITKNVQLLGDGFGTNVGDGGTTRLYKVGNFTGIVVSDVNAGAENLIIDGAPGNGGLGLSLIGGRSYARKVTATSHGSHGIQVGDLTGSSVNAWRLQDVITLGNGGNGVYINSGTGSPLPNANAGYLLGLDSRDNALDGLCLENCFDNTFIGVVSQSNDGIGIRIKSGAKGNCFINPYTEDNTSGTSGEIVLESGSFYNTVFGYRNSISDNIVDNGTGNYITGRAQQITGHPTFIKSQIVFKDLIIEDPTALGYYRFVQNSSTKDLEITYEGSSSTPVRAIIKHNNSGKLILQADGLDVGPATSFPITARLHAESSLNFPSIPANSTAELTVTITGAVLRDLVIATPESLEAGLTWNAYVSATNTVKLRVANVTTSAIDPASVPWAFDVWQS
jgi:hypothetical protein